MLRISIPNSYLAERRYSINVLMVTFLGLDIDVEVGDVNHIVIADGNGKELILDDSLFSFPESKWLTESSLPLQPLRTWDLAYSPIDFNLEYSTVPVIFGQKVNADDFLVVTENKIQLGIDIFGSAFFMLSRYEEYVRPERDGHGRFPASASLAHKEGFLNRAIINEYLEILWQSLTFLWPQLTRKERSYQVLLSHDVDEPFYAFIKDPKRIAGSLVADVVKRKEPTLAVKRAVSMITGRFGQTQLDPFDTFNFLMDCSERHGLQSGFYFMASDPSYDTDNRYDVGHPLVRKLIKKIDDREHEIGLHPSMNSYESEAVVARELKLLRRVLSEEKVAYNSLGGRQHYLRWSNPKTWQIWEDNGMTYDSTLTFAEVPGFRCGVCYEYPAFNLDTRRSLNLIERPLIVMERSVLSYMKSDPSAAIEIVGDLARQCRRYGGLMTMLWHNNALMTSADRTLYSAICEEICS